MGSTLDLGSLPRAQMKESPTQWEHDSRLSRVKTLGRAPQRRIALAFRDSKSRG